MRTDKQQNFDLLNELSVRERIRDYGIRRYFEHMIAEKEKILLDRSDRAGKLWYTWQWELGGRACFLEYVCPSTGKKYVSGIAPQAVQGFITFTTIGVPISTLPDGVLAEIAMAWKLQLELYEYREISAES